MKDRIGLISVYFPLFDREMPPGFRQKQEDLARHLEAVLVRGGLEVVFPGLIDSESRGRDAGQRFREASIEGLVVAPTMAAPPSYTMAAVDECPRPILVWNPERTRLLPADLTETQATGWSGLVGCIMVSNTLVRRRHPFATVTCVVDSPDEIQRVVRLARVVCVAHRFRAMRLLRLGAPIPGYLDVELDSAQLEQDLGAKVIDVQPADLERTYQEIREDEVDRLLAHVQQEGWQLREAWPELRTSARLALALEELCRRHQAGAGAVNCHGSLFRENHTTGIVACLGVSWLSAHDCPFACTGDLPTAIALKIGKELTGSALYCECYARESDSGLILIAAGGEGDSTLAEPETAVEVYPNRHYPGVRGCGACVRFKLRPGPATLLSFSPVSAGWRLIWATGEVLPAHFPAMVGPNALFRFSQGASRSTVERWCESGPTHHNALVPGHIAEELSVFTRLAGIEGVSVDARVSGG